MNVSDKLKKLYEEIDKIKEKSCDNCQEFDCDFCPFEYEDDNESEEWQKLKPCPFCGGTKIDIRTDDGGISWYVFCNDCGVICGYSMTKDDAINAWNERSSTQK